MSLNFVGNLAIGLMVIGTVGGMIPLWKSARLSPDSIKRRVYWACMGATTLLLFVSVLPDWWASLFVGGGLGLSFVMVAFRWTGHIEIRGRVYSARSDERRPDRPPALSNED